MSPQAVLDFWFSELTPAQWFRVDPELDAQIRTRFLATHRQAQQGELYSWRCSAEGRLAEVIVLDQFSRNIHRNTAQAFASDVLALVLAQEAVASGADRTLPVQQRGFFYMPYMHSESARIHAAGIPLFQTPGMEGTLDYELKHKAIIDRFGRYPHRNEILGRPSTEEELEFLKQPGSSF